MDAADVHCGLWSFGSGRGRQVLEAEPAEEVRAVVPRVDVPAELGRPATRTILRATSAGSASGGESSAWRAGISSMVPAYSSS